jgi:hypothetical protein
VRLEGLGQSEKSNDLIGNRNHDLPACSIVPRLTRPLNKPKIDIHINCVHCKACSFRREHGNTPTDKRV